MEAEKGMRLSYTPEEIGAMHDRNESFQGIQANFEKLQLYQTIKRGLMEFKERCECVQVVDGYDPNPREKHAILWADFSPAAALDNEQAAALAAIMNEVDGIVITAIEECTRISFVIQDIWEK